MSSRSHSQHHYKVAVTGTSGRKRKCTKCLGKGIISYALGINARTIELDCIECKRRGVVYPEKRRR